MKLYVVIADTCEEWGVEISLFGIFSQKSKAEKRKEEIEGEFGNAQIFEVNKNSDCDIYLGGYIE